MTPTMTQDCVTLCDIFFGDRQFRLAPLRLGGGATFVRFLCIFLRRHILAPPPPLLGCVAVTVLVDVFPAPYG